MTWNKRDYKSLSKKKIIIQLFIKLKIQLNVHWLLYDDKYYWENFIVKLIINKNIFMI